MKKAYRIVLAIAAVAVLAGCITSKNKSGSRDFQKKTTVSDLLAEESANMAKSDDNASENGADSAANGSGLEKAEKKDKDSQVNSDEFDVDLTINSATLVYSMVYDMMMHPESYVGKSVIMKGTYTTCVDETSGIRYFACIIKDATACCAQGIEFELSDDYVYPDDYPKEGDTVTVSGTFDVYYENGYSYCTLRDARLN